MHSTTNMAEDGGDAGFEVRNHLLQVINTIIRILEAGNLENDCFDGLEFRLDWIYGAVILISKSWHHRRWSVNQSTRVRTAHLQH